MFKSTVIYSLGYGVNRGLFLFSFPFLAAYLSLSDFGLYALILTLSQLLLPLQSLNGSAVLMREGVTDKSIAVNIYIKYIVITFFITIFFALLVNFILLEDYYWLLYASLLSGSEALLLLTLTFYRAQDKPLLYLYITFIKSFIVLSVIYFTIHNDMGLKLILQWQVVASVLFALILVLIVIIQNFNIVNISKMKLENSLLFGILLLPHGISQWILNSSDRLVIKYVENDVSLGAYTIGYTFASILFLMNSGITMAIPQLMIKDYKSWIRLKKDTVFIQYYSIFAVALYILLWIFIYVDKNILNFIHHYNMSVLLTFTFAYLGIFILGYYYFFANYLFYHRLAKVISTQTIIVALLNVVLTIALVFLMGFVGASLATLITYGFYLFIVKNVAIKVEPKLKGQLTHIVKILVISLLALCIMSVIGVIIIK